MSHNPGPAIFEQKKINSILALWLFSMVICLCGVYITRDYLMDDALITLRYSYNFSRYGIPIWNQADLATPSMGYTSLLWMLSNTIPALIVNNRDSLVIFAQQLSFISLSIIVFFVIHEIHSLAIPTPLKFASAFVIFSQIGYGFHVNSGMETMMFSCLALLTVAGYGRGRYRLAYVLGLLSFLARPEGAILIALLCLWDVINRRIKQSLIGAFSFLVLVAATLLLLYYWYGGVLPNTYYAKQEGINSEALIRTGFFIATLGMPFMIMSAYASFVLKNKTSMYMFVGAITYMLYYTSVDPVMNVMSRYQWPVLVLLTYASIPVIVPIYVNIKKYRIYAVALLFMMLIANVGNGLGAAYFAGSTGHAMKNLIIIGKAMREYRSPDKWLVYHDAGAVCYFSDWNTHEIIGLTNGPLARGEIKLSDIYKNPNAQIVLRNFDLLHEGQKAEKDEFTKMLSQYGYKYIRDLPILSVSGQRDFVVAVYARDPDFAKTVFQDVQLTAPLKPNTLYYFYNIAKEIVGR